MIGKAYAKLNLTLNILNKRDDGYHNLKSVMVPIDLFDEIKIEKNDIYQLVTNYDIDTCDNIITKVFNIFKHRYNVGNVKIILNKNIPDKAGLAGGSADATCVIRLLNNLFNLNLSVKQLEDIALEVGSDTLFTLHNKPAVVTSRGDEISFIDINHDFHILLIKPKFGISTKDAFLNIKDYNLKHNDQILNELKNNDINMIDKLCYNSFLDSILENKDFKLLYNELSKYKVPHLSGSGSTLFVISDNVEELKNIKEKFSEHFTYITKIINCYNSTNTI